VLDANEFQCTLRNQGDVCVNVFTSPYPQGGFWPAGGPDGYVFAAGIQLAGIVPADAGFSWAGDTVGAYFYDPRGTQQHGEGITNIYDSLDPDDLAGWPNAGSIPEFPEATAYVSDPEIFDPELLGRKAASEQDSWVLYWDGNPAFSANRDHPMGILVEQRTLAWTRPGGNEATIYFIFRLQNVTNNPHFQVRNEEAFFEGANELPDAGWRIDSIYMSFGIDPDVAEDYHQNHASVIPPLNLGLAYDSDFRSDQFEYPASHFHPPFFTESPGIVAVKYLKTPVDPATGEQVGLTMFSLTENPSLAMQFPDPLGTPQLWRYLSGNFSTALGDPSCSVPPDEVIERGVCFLGQEPRDTRFYQSSGPFPLEPGESTTIVVALFAAATVETDEIVLGDINANPPGVPSDRPGCEEPLRPIEIGAGWISSPAAACAAPGGVDLSQIESVPGSLVGKALVAQAIFDQRFLPVHRPEPPDFHLLPGNGRVTVVWSPSPTEEIGDPYFDFASDPTNPAFNPNYRQHDVEGYRVYRGLHPWKLELVAQFDKSDSRFIDHICETDPTHLPRTPCDETVDIDIVSPFVQYRPGWIVEAANGLPIVQRADTTLAAALRAGTALPMRNTGVPFTFVDESVANGFDFYYEVTAFDINSVSSGPTSLESEGVPKRIVPRAPASDDLSRIHTVPDPYYAVSPFDRSSTQRRLAFVNLPERATVRIYSTSGILVGVVNHHDPGGGGQAFWDLRDLKHRVVASGVYFYHVTTRDGREHIGKFTVVMGPY
jgi:hypothetical protein